MANNYLQFSEVLAGLTAEETTWLQKRLEDASEDDTDADAYEEYFPDFSWEVTPPSGDKPGALWVYAEESGDVTHVAKVVEEFFKKFRPDGVFTLTWAETCSRMRPGEFSGGWMLVTATDIEIESVSERLAVRADALALTRAARSAPALPPAPSDAE